MKGKTYYEAGVDLEAAQEIKLHIRDLVATTLGSEVISGPGGFGGVIEPNPKSEFLLVSSTDSVGTKLKIAEAMNRHDTIGLDIVNHCINDILPAGATPLFFLDYIGTSKLNSNVISDIVKGLSSGCRTANMALIGGETAVLPGIYHGNDYDLVGFIVGTVNRNHLISPDKTSEGDMLIALPSSGLHTNGYSFVRSIFDIDNNPSVLKDVVPGTSSSLGELLLVPHRSYYDTFGQHLNIINGLSHITGGSFYKNVPRVLSDGIIAEIDISSWKIPPLFKFIQESGNVSDDEMFRVFNMGVGMIAVVSEKSAEFLMSELDECWVLGNTNKRTSENKVGFKS